MLFFGDKTEKIKKWGEKGKKDKLIEILTNGGNPKYRAEAAKALGNVKNLDVANILITYLRDPDAEVRANIIESLGKLRAKNAEEHIRRIYNSENDPKIKEVALNALNSIRNGLG